MLTMIFLVTGVFSLHSDVIGESYSNSVDSHPSSAITYKMASVGNYKLDDEAGGLAQELLMIYL